jgi:hypothetical protein
MPTLEIEETPMTLNDQPLEPIAALARSRDGLVAAVRADLRRTHRRRRATIFAAAACVTFAGVSVSIAATTGLFRPAPSEVKETFRRLDPATRVDASRAVEIGVIDEHAAYAAPRNGGGFCLYFAPNPRSGPNGSICTTSDPSRDEILLNTSVGTDGGFVFGRVGNADAEAVDVEIPNGGGIVTSRVGESGFFLAQLTDRALDAITTERLPGPNDPPTKDGGPITAFDQSLIDAITATARSADGTVVAAGTHTPLPNPGERTETTATPGS